MNSGIKLLCLLMVTLNVIGANAAKLDAVEYKDIALEKAVSQQELDSKLKDKDIEYLKNSIDKLEVKLDNSLVNLKTYDIKIDGFDRRISDINLYLVLWGVLITLIMAFMMFKTRGEAKQEAKEAIQKWIDKEAEGELKTKIDDHIEHDKKEHIGDLIKEKIENSVAIQITELKAIIEDLKNKSKEGGEELDDIKKIKVEAQDTLKSIEVSKEDIKNSEGKAFEKRSDKDYYNLGVDALNSKSYNEAIFNFEQALKHNNNFAKDKIYFALGFAYDKLKEYDKVIDAYQKSVAINPQKYGTYNNMGVTYVKLKEYGKAIDAYKEAVAINPQKDEAYYNMGIAYHEKEEFDKAIDAYKEAVAINPQKDEAYYNMGNAYGNLKEYGKAIDTYKEVVAINPQKGEAYTNLFELQLIQKEPFDQELEGQYLKRFSDNKESKVQYDMLKVFENITHGKENGLEAWKRKYEGVGLGGWSFGELKVWIDAMEGSERKDRLQEALAYFKSV